MPNNASPPIAPSVLPNTRDLAIQVATDAYFDTLGPGPHSPIVIAGEITEIANREIARLILTAESTDSTAKKQAKPQRLQNPTAAQVATALIRLHHVIRLDEGGLRADRSQLAVYLTDGERRGIYSTDEGDIRRLIRHYVPAIGRTGLADLLQTLLDLAPLRRVCDDGDLIALDNGAFSYNDRTLRPFSPELVLLSKSPVAFVEDPPNPTIHNPDDNTDWNIESWMQEIASVPDPDGGPSVVDPQVVETLWQIVGAVIRPLVHWNKAAFLYSTTGNNGKGTYCELLRAITGPASTNIPLADLSKEFYLEGLSNHSAIIADENDVGVFLDRVGNLKALITQDVILVNRKNRTPISLRWRGLMVQCLNGLPESRDKSQSFYRRQLFVPFRNRFEGVERTYIKFDYLHRTDVLEYALHKVLTMEPYTQLQTPDASLHLMRNYQLANDNVREFWDEVSEEFVWGMVPQGFVYQLYVAWMERNNPSGKPVGRNRVLTALRELLGEDPYGEWVAPTESNGTPRLIRVGAQMAAPEPLIDTYNLTDWMPANYTGHNPTVRTTVQAPERIRGFVRRSVWTTLAASHTQVGAVAVNP